MTNWKMYSLHSRISLACQGPYWSNPAGYVIEMTAGYDVGIDFYVQDGVVKYGLVEDGFYDYLTMMNRWYENGLLYADFAASLPTSSSRPATW